MTDRLQLRALGYFGPHREPSVIEFGPGLNVIYGASNTGKSFIVETIDFMLGGKGPLRDVPERVGYKHALLAFETSDGEAFTLVRDVAGGPFKRFAGIHTTALPDSDGETLAEQHNERKDDNLSAFLLGLIDLQKQRIKKNQKGETQSLSFRNIARLIVINEEEIIQQRSPLADGGYVSDTANTSAFKLLLTGVDDSSLVPDKAKSAENQNRQAQIDLLNQLIKASQQEVKALAGPPKELSEQLERLEEGMHSRGEQLAISEKEFREASGKRRKVAKQIEEARNRLTEVTALLERFTLLTAHYRSDTNRLEAIAEAGSLFAALGEVDCPLCGAAAEHHRHDRDCDGDVDRVIAAANSEIGKIKLKQGELQTTISSLRQEAAAFENRLPKLEQRLSGLSAEIEKVVAPNLRKMRKTYRDLADKSGEVREALAVHRNLTDLEKRRDDLLALGEQDAASDPKDVDLSTSTVDAFATETLRILKAWHFPNVTRVHFDLKAKDLVIDGKARTSFGKGLRAITQAAFTVSLQEYCFRNDMPHPGFIVLDSPLLSYREPEGDDDDLRSTDLNRHFYDFLSDAGADRQFIIVENTDPPNDFQKRPQVTMFSGNDGQGREGLFL
ncbi:MAG: AAA family ATPase [Pseudomonadota bacterium]